MFAGVLQFILLTLTIQGDCFRISQGTSGYDKSLVQAKGKGPVKYKHRGDLCASCYVGQREQCKIKPGRNCSVETLNSRGFVNVYPGGQTACLDGSDYFFTVRPGDTTKLHIHFQGGGACWNRGSYEMDLCRKYVHPESEIGAFDLGDPSNPWQKYSFVIINYCSGDMHGGTTMKRYSLFGKNKVRGFFNAQSALRYVQSNFLKLDKLTVSGSSAGSLGLQLWSRRLLEIFSSRAKDITLVADSFIGVMYPPSETVGAESYLFNDWNMCNPTLLDEEEMKKCKDNQLVLSDVFSDAMDRNRGVRFAAVNSKEDFVQIGFEKAFGLSRGSRKGFEMSGAQFYLVASNTLGSWMKHDNFHSYLVDSIFHTYLPYGHMYSTTPEGAEAGDASHVGPGLVQWLTELIDPTAEPMKTVCWGEEKNLTGKETELPQKYCSGKLFGYTSA